MAGLVFVTAPSAALAEPTRYKLQPDITHVRFIAKTNLHPFEGETTVVRGHMVFDPVTNQLVEPAEIAVMVKEMQTGIAARDRAMRKMFEADRFPALLVTIDSLTPVDVSDQTARRYRLEGRLQIRRIEQPIAFEVHANMLGESLEASGRVPLTMTVFQLKPPTVFGLIRVSHKVMVEFISYWKRQRPAS